MNFDVNMTDRQTVAIGVQIVDKDGQPLESLPEGASVTFTSDNDGVVQATVRPDGMNADVASGKVGTGRITIHATGLVDPTNGQEILLEDDVVRFIVRNSAPGSLNTTVGAPTDET